MQNNDTNSEDGLETEIELGKGRSGLETASINDELIKILPKGNQAQKAQSTTNFYHKNAALSGEYKILATQGSLCSVSPLNTYTN